MVRWFSPAASQFEIECDRSRRYEPDFVVECINRKSIAEVKAELDLADLIVQEKACAACAWVENANKFAAKGNGKPWSYALLFERDLPESPAMSGVMAKAA